MTQLKLTTQTVCDKDAVAMNNHISKPRAGIALPMMLSLLSRATASARTTVGLAFTPQPSGDDKSIVFIRHGCTYMNEYLGRSIPFGGPDFSDVFEDNERAKFYQDTPLSPKGVRQAQNLLAKSPPSFVHDCDLIVTSPLTRALQTLDIGLKHHFSEESAVPIIALPHAAERLYLVSDVGRARSELEEKFPYVDFETGFEGHEKEWWYKPNSKKNYVEWRPTGKGQRYACPAEPDEDFDQRMKLLVSWLDQRPEKRIAVVCHWGVIDWMLDLDFDNCQWREVPHSSLRQRAGIMAEQQSK
jgi:broad specificity phosphatase PhoE